jgi:hypothetical protein
MSNAILNATPAGDAPGSLGLSRRALLGGVASILAAGAAALPMRQLWTDFLTEVPAGLDDLSLAYRLARRRGKPLLAIFVQGDFHANTGFDRQQAFRDLLRHGEDHELIPLALCRPVRVCFQAGCALFNLPATPKDIELLLIETTGTQPVGTPLFAKLDLEPQRAFAFPEPAFQRVICANGRMLTLPFQQTVSRTRYDAKRLAAQSWSQRRERYQRLSRTIAQAVAKDLETLNRRAQDTARVLSSTNREAVEGALARHEPPAEPLRERAAALIALSAARAQDLNVRDQLFHALAAAVRDSSIYE